MSVQCDVDAVNIVNGLASKLKRSRDLWPSDKAAAGPSFFTAMPQEVADHYCDLLEDGGVYGHGE